MAGRKPKDKKDIYAYITFTAPREFKEDLDKTIESGDKSRFLRNAAAKELKKYKKR